MSIDAAVHDAFILQLHEELAKAANLAIHCSLATLGFDLQDNWDGVIVALEVHESVKIPCQAGPEISRLKTYLLKPAI